MTAPPTRCDVWVDGAWRSLSLVEALVRHRAANKRCPHCHGPVRIQGVYGHQFGAVMRHMGLHDGCPLIPRRYAGTPKPHPQALA